MSTVDADELLALGTATLYEASGLDCVLPCAIRPVWSRAAVVGAALPVRTAPGDNLPLHLALEQVQPGEVLVVDGGGAAYGYWGEVLTVAAQQRGVAGLVIAGGVRDTDRLEALQFPVFASAVAIAGTVKNDLGDVGGDVRLGAVTVARGDLVVADRDGIVVLPADRVAETVSAARRRAATEQAYLRRLRAGELTLDIYGLRPAPVN